MRVIALIPVLSLIGAAVGGSLSGCAKGPAGGPVVPTANRLTVNMTLQQAINPNFYYSFAFDDDGDPSDGPQAIIGTTRLANRIVSGSFTVLVQYNRGQFRAFRRTFLGNEEERLEPVSNAFVVPPTASGNTIQFTLNLDAVVDTAANPPTDADRLFVPNLQRLDVNFVTTSEIIISPENLQQKPFDALGTGAFGFIGNVDVSSTRTYSNSTQLIETTNDVYVPPFSPISAQQQAQLDITDFTLDVRRSN